MEVYIFRKDRQCPYLHYAFLISEVEQYANEHLDWNSMEHKVDIPFLHQWLHDAQEKQQSYSSNKTEMVIYQASIETLKDIISVAESGRTNDWFEVYITRF